MRLVRSTLGLLLCVVLPAVPADCLAGNERSGSSSAATARALSKVRREALARWADKDWGYRTDADDLPALPADSADVIPNEKLIELLSRRHHRETAVDAYIRWRLMAFGPDLSNVPPQRVARLIRTWPKFAPEPSAKRPAGARSRKKQQSNGLVLGRQRVIQTGVRPVSNSRGGRGTHGFRQELTVVRSGTALDVEGAVNPNDPRYVTMTVRTLDFRLQRLRRVANFGNQPVRRLRNQLIAAMPVENGSRLAAAMQDAADRISTGDATYLHAVRRAVDESERPQLQLSPGQYRQMVAFAKRLERMKSEVIDDWEREGGQYVPKGQLIVFPLKEYHRLMANLDATQSARPGEVGADGRDGQGDDLPDD